VTIPDSVTSIGVNAFYGCENLKYAPLMIVDGKIIYEPDNRNDVHFSEMEQLILKRDYSMKMNHDVKYHLIAQMFTAGIDEEGVSAYIKKNFAKMFKYLIDHDDVEAVTAIINSGKFLTKRNVDKHINYAIDNGHFEIQVLLMDYKADKIGYSDPMAKFKL
jgi:hypothetical protein